MKYSTIVTLVATMAIGSQAMAYVGAAGNAAKGTRTAPNAARSGTTGAAAAAGKDVSVTAGAAATATTGLNLNEYLKVGQNSDGVVQGFRIELEKGGLDAKSAAQLAEAFRVGVVIPSGCIQNLGLGTDNTALINLAKIVTNITKDLLAQGRSINSIVSAIQNPKFSTEKQRELRVYLRTLKMQLNKDFRDVLSTPANPLTTQKAAEKINELSGETCFTLAPAFSGT